MKAPSCRSQGVDRLDPARYYNHLIISAPSRSGTTHLTVETILQAYGGTKDGRCLLNAGGNMAHYREQLRRPRGGHQRPYESAWGIDFFGLSALPAASRWSLPIRH